MKKAILVTAALCLAPAAARAQDNVLAPPPAPQAAPQEQAPDWMQYKNPYAGEENNIANANRTSDEITAWGSRAVADALTFRPDDFNGQIKMSQKFFVQSGWGDYANYLKQSQLLGVAQSGKYSVATIANGDPMILDSGAQNGAWHWTLSVPVITSVSAPDPKGALQPVSTRKTRITLVLTRVLEGGFDGIAIEGWKSQDQ